jgi:hypothetical protein
MHLRCIPQINFTYSNETSDATWDAVLRYVIFMDLYLTSSFVDMSDTNIRNAWVAHGEWHKTFGEFGRITRDMHQARCPNLISYHSYPGDSDLRDALIMHRWTHLMAIVKYLMKFGHASSQMSIWRIAEMENRWELAIWRIGACISDASPV